MEVSVSKPMRKTVTISCIYRTPGSNIDMFIESLEKIFTDNKPKTTMFICGDFNIDLLKYEEHAGSAKFIDTMYSNGLYPLIDKPTRITQQSATLIDNIFTNDMTHDIICGLLINDISDHLPLFSISGQSITRHKYQQPKHIRQVNKQSLDAFIKDLDKQSWENTLISNDVNTAYNSFLDSFIELYDKNCPIKLLKDNKNVKTSKPWFTNGLRNACIKRKRLYKDYITNRTLDAEVKYKSYRNKLTSILRKSEKQYYNQLLIEQKGNVKNIWKILNTIIRKPKNSHNYPDAFVDKGIFITDKNEMVNKFNEYFVNVGIELANKIAPPNQHVSVHDYLITKNKSSIFLDPVLEQDIIVTVNSCKSKTSCDFNGIDMKVVKKVVSYIARPLSDICNKSFTQGVFPDNMKVGKVIPLYKAGDRNVFSNYRPISLLSQFSKILEKLFNEKLDKFIDKCNLLNDCQYGFRNKMCTTHALINLVEEISSSLDAKKFSIGVFIDLKKAFDTVNHALLIDKLEFYGVRGPAKMWL